MLLVQSQSVLCPFMTKHSSLSKLDLFWHMTVTFPSTLNCFLFYKQSKKCEKENITVNNKKKCFKKKKSKTSRAKIKYCVGDDNTFEPLVCSTPHVK